MPDTLLYRTARVLGYRITVTNVYFNRDGYRIDCPNGHCIVWARYQEQYMSTWLSRNIFDNYGVLIDGINLTTSDTEATGV